MEKRSALTISMVQSNFTNGMKPFVPYNPFRENSPFLAIKSKTYGNWYADFLNHNPIEPKLARRLILIYTPKNIRIK